MARASQAQLIGALRMYRPAPARALAAALRVSQPTLSRALKALGGELVVRGSGRRTRYALRRPVRGNAAPVPLYAIDAEGRGAQIAALDCTAPGGSALAFQAPFPWPLAGDMHDGWFDGLPYPIVDMRPQGFLGRRFARQHARLLGIPEDPDTWGDDEIVHTLSVAGADPPGDLILGEAAYRQFLEARRPGATRFLADADLQTEYPQRAAQALAEGAGGSPVAGEFPKFTATRSIDAAPVHVIVKFSGSDDSPAVARWADLLVCEHLAAEILREQLGIAAARTRILRIGGRTFLEVERFDRHGAHGRSPACTLESLNAALLGAPLPWPAVAARLRDRGYLKEVDAQAIVRIHWFGRLIANTDMHDGNLAFRPGLALAPAYDMLPMLYAPARGGELPERHYDPPLPLPNEARAWRETADAAHAFWLRCGADERIGARFRTACRQNARALAQAIVAA
jgi:DNA-binding transcriptional ArsR family regulator